MPYLGIRGDEEVIPPQVANGTTVQCPTCDDEMSVTQSHYRGESFVSRHFRHKSDGYTRESSGNGEGGSTVCLGESDVHHKMKAIAYARLEEDFPDATVELEGHVEGRFADVLLTFPEPCPPYGKGIAVEAQYRNEGKDIEGVTEHYFERSYSVAWLEEDDFTNHDVDLSGVLTLWPYALPDRRGTEGYPEVVRWLWQEKNPSVELDIPIPGEYWTSFNKDGEWLTVAERNLKLRGSIRIAKSPTGDITLGMSKATFEGAESVAVQASQGDADSLRTFASQLDRIGFGDERPPPEECDPEWHNLTTCWLAGTVNVTAWISAVLPEPDSQVVLQLGKKRHGDSKTIQMQVQSNAPERIREIADLLEQTFEIKQGNESIIDF